MAAGFPISLRGVSEIWVGNNNCSTGRCYRKLNLADSQIRDSGNMSLPRDAGQPVPFWDGHRILTIVGKDTTKEDALVLDEGAHPESRVALPNVISFFGPLVPNWFEAEVAPISSDDSVAAIARTRIAWVLTDTDRDWGSEIVVLRLQPLAVIANLKTGKGGVRALAVDHRDGHVRIVGFWNDIFHTFESEDINPGKWKEIHVQ